jgi:CopG family nickel-responsive transcriptional regulator
MKGVTRFGVSMDGTLLHNFDKLISRKGYRNRSEALRDLIRDNLVQKEWEVGNQETVGTLALVYNHHTRELTRVLTDLQHRFYKNILSATHVHLDEHNCLEVLILRGKGKDIQNIGDRLIGTRGVKHGKLSLTTAGKNLR